MNEEISDSVGDPKAGPANRIEDVKTVQGLLNVQIVKTSSATVFLPSMDAPRMNFLVGNAPVPPILKVYRSAGAKSENAFVALTSGQRIVRSRATALKPVR